MDGRASTLALALVLTTAGLAGCIGDGEADLDQLAQESGIVVDVTPESGDVDTTFTFDASQTPNADALTFTWAFEGGGNATGTTVEHSFPWTNHAYEVEVTASNGTASLSQTIEVEVGSGQNAAPSVTATSNKNWVAHGEPVELTADAHDDDGDPIEVTWLVAEKQEQGGHGHDHDHGGGGEQDEGDPYGIPQETGETGAEASLTFNESGTYRIVAEAADAKGATDRDRLEVKVTRTVPKPTFTLVETGTLAAGTAAGETDVSVSEILYDAQEPSQNTFIDAARYDTRLVYPGSGTLSLDWSNSTAPADLELTLVDETGSTVVSLSATEDPTTDRMETDVELSDGSYTIYVRANAGANIEYTVTLDLDLEIPGLTVDVDDGHDDGHDGHDH